MTETERKPTGSRVGRPLLAVALAASAAVPAPAMAATDIFLKLDNVVGESLADGHKNEIELLSYSTGFSAGAIAQGSPGAGRVSARPSCSAFSAMKLLDRSSPPLLTAVMTGQHFQKAEIQLVRTGEGSGAPFLKYELQDVMVSSLQEGGSSETPTESISLNFGRLTVYYKPQNAGGSLGDAVVSSVDCGLPAVQ